MFSLWRASLGILAGLLSTIAFVSAAVSSETDYPKQSIRILVPYAAGGSTDAIARLVAKELTTELGQPFFVENKPGAGGVIAHDQASKAEPDGTTLLFSAAGPLTVT